MTHPSTHRGVAWRSVDLGGPDGIAIDVDLTDLLVSARTAADRVAEVTDLGPDDVEVGAAAAGLDRLADELAHGRGLAMVRGFDTTAESQRTIEAMFWRIGLWLGAPVSQSVMGDRLGHVVDVSDVDPHARAYRRNEELTPHTDPADFLAFLCLHPAAEGGVNHFVSSLAIHDRIAATRPELLERLRRGYRWSRFGEQADDLEPITPHRIPVFSERDGAISCRLVRQYIEIAAAEDPSCTLDDLDREALLLVEALGAETELSFEIRLGPGDAIFANNFTVMHDRTAFRDGPGERRHLLRLWIESHTPRPVVDKVQLYPGSAGIPPQSGRTPSYATDVDVF